MQLDLQHRDDGVAVIGDKSAGRRRVLGKWSPFASAIIGVVLLVTVGTVLVGMQLYKVTSHQAQFSTR